MEQLVRVKKTFDDGTALVIHVRESACSGDCHKCSGCGAAKEAMLFTADNPLGARTGDLVKVVSQSAPVLKGAAVLYVLPLVLFFLGYYLGTLPGNFGVLGGCLGFLLGCAGVVLWISSGLIPSRPLSRTIPSTTYKGSFDLLIELAPRTRILRSPPGTPLDITDIPDTRPCKASSMRVTGWSLNCLLSITATEPARSALRTVP